MQSLYLQEKNDFSCEISQLQADLSAERDMKIALEHKLSEAENAQDTRFAEALSKADFIQRKANQRLDQANETIQSLRQNLEQKEETIIALTRDTAAQGAHQELVNSLNSTLQGLEQQLDYAKAELAELEDENELLTSEVAAQDHRINDLETRNAILAEKLTAQGMQAESMVALQSKVRALSKDTSARDSRLLSSKEQQ